MERQRRLIFEYRPFKRLVLLVQPIHLLRIFSGLTLRLGLSGAFLLSSAGLVVAASLLLYTAADGVGGRRSWKATADSGTTAFRISQGNRPKVLLTLTTYVGPTTLLPYSFPDNFTYRSLTTNQVADGFLATNGVVPVPLPTPLDAATATMQRSWNIIKSAFR